MIRAAICSLVLAVPVSGQTTRPTSRPDANSQDMRFMSADQVVDQMLKPTTRPAQQLRPLPEGPVQDVSSGRGAVKPDAPTVQVTREGTFIIDRTGRLTKNDKGQFEFTFESDGKALRDPPMLLLPNLKLAQLEDAVTSQSRDLKVRVTGRVTEYRGRNYLLLDMVIVPPDVTQQF